MVKVKVPWKRGMELEHHTFLTTTLDEGQFSATCFHSITLTKDSNISNVQEDAGSPSMVKRRW
jgi:hypothetical protein